MRTTKELKEAVSRGEEWLRKKLRYKSWREAIKAIRVDQLDMGSGRSTLRRCGCIISEIDLIRSGSDSGDYMNLRPQNSANRGFSVRGEFPWEYNSEFAALTELWKPVIRKLQKEIV